MDELEVLQPPRGFAVAWSRPANVRVVQTTRFGGVSHAPYGSLNLAGHVGDAPRHVTLNRARVARFLELPSAPFYLTQVHGNRVVQLEALAEGEAVEADGAVTATPDHVAAILTADCLPILLTTVQGDCVGALHGGWRGLCAGVVEAGLEALHTAPEEVLAWIGPGIGSSAYRVDRTVIDAACARHPWAERFATPIQKGSQAEAPIGARFEPVATADATVGRTTSAFADAMTSSPDTLDPPKDASVAPSREQFQFDLAGYAASILHEAGVESVTLSGACTAGTSGFFSHRREGTTGRTATLIWLAQSCA